MPAIRSITLLIPPTSMSPSRRCFLQSHRWPINGQPNRLRQRRLNNLADDPTFTSLIDNPPQLVRAGHDRRRPFLFFLLLIPVTAFALGTWQIFRLRWKTDMITKYEDRILKPPLPLPPRIDPSAISEFNYRRVYATGILRYDQEMLIGPRIHDGRNGFYVVTPLERGDGASKVLVNRGWIPKKFENQRHRKVGLPTGRVTVQGLLREPWKKNLFTPDNKPEDGAFYFPDVHQMADFSGSDRVWIEETMEQDLIKAMDREAVGIPIGRAAAVNLRNNHTQYIFTWYALSAATSVMFWMLVKKPPPDIARRVRQSKEWS